MEDKKIINRVYVKNESGEVFIIDNGEKNRWSNNFDNFSDSKDDISDRMFELIDKYGHIYFPIAVEVAPEPGIHTRSVDEEKLNKEVLIKIEKDFSVVDILERIKSIIGKRFQESSGDNRNSLFSIIKNKVNKDEKLKKKVALDVIKKLKELVGDKPLSDNSEIIKNIRIFLNEFSNFELLALGSIDSEIKTMRKNFIENERASLISEVFNARPVLKKLNFQYEYLRDILDIRTFLIESRMFDRDEDEVKELFFIFAMMFTKELDKDVDFKNRVKNRLNFSYLTSLSLNNFFSITTMTNKNIVLLNNVMRECFDSFPKFEPLIAMEFYRRNLVEEAHKCIEMPELRDTQKNLIFLMNHIMNISVRERGERVMNQFVYEKYKEAFTTIKVESLSFVEEKNLKEILNVIKNFSVNTNISKREAFGIFFDKDSYIEKMDFIKDNDTLRKKILIKSQLEIQNDDNSIENKYRFTKNEIQNIMYSDINSVYLKFYSVIRTFDGEYEHLTEDQVSGIHREFFKVLASSNTSERKNAVRMLSSFLHFASHQVSEFASDEELDKRIKILIKEMSNSTLRNNTIASIINNPYELYKDSPHDYRIKHSTSNTILGKEYTHVSQLIQDEKDIREIVKSTILLNILN
jgi:hypothetical protein